MLQLPAVSVDLFHLRQLHGEIIEPQPEFPDLGEELFPGLEVIRNHHVLQTEQTALNPSRFSKQMKTVCLKSHYIRPRVVIEEKIVIDALRLAHRPLREIP
jgi:hypothetical protein